MIKPICFPNATCLCCVCCLVTQSCQTLCNPMDYTVHRILQARILEWIAIPFLKGSSQPRDQTCVFRIASGYFTVWATREALCPLVCKWTDGQILGSHTFPWEGCHHSELTASPVGPFLGVMKRWNRLSLTWKGHLYSYNKNARQPGCSRHWHSD